jgi:hypothetical protein
MRNRHQGIPFGNAMIGFGDLVFNSTLPTPIRQKVVGLNRSLPEFYRGVTIDTDALRAVDPLPETADELRAVT